MKTTKPYELLFLIVAMVISAIICLWMVLIPSISENTFIGKYSFQRFILILLTGIAFLSFLSSLISFKNKIVSTILSKLFSSKFIFVVSFITGLISLSIIILYFLNVYGPRTLLIQRLFPILLYGFLFSFEMVLFQQIVSKEEIGRSVKSLIRSLWEKSIEKINGFYIRLLKVFDQSFVPIILLILINAPIILVNSIRFYYPMGFAGLYTLIAEEIVKYNFLLPFSVPFYGPGGIPFAYPPLAFYIMAFFIGPLKISSLLYLRFAPPLFYLFSSLLFYALVKEYTKSRRIGFISSILFAYSSTNYYIHGTSGGSVRGLALCFLFAGLLIFLRNIDQFKLKSIILSGLFFSLTILTHLSYAFVFATVLLVVILCKPFNWKRWGVTILLGVTGLILSSPWWGTIIHRFGVEVFSLAFASHGNNYFLKILSGEKSLIDWLSVSFGTFSLNQNFSVFALLGLVYMILGGEIFPLLLFVLLMFSSSENGRYLVMLGSLTAGLLISKISRLLAFWRNNKRWQLSEFVIILFSLFLICNTEVNNIINYKPVITKELVDFSILVRKNVSKDANYLFIIGHSDQEAEWLPYFFDLTPSVGPWGGEWLTLSPIQIATGPIADCQEKHSYSCVKEVIFDYGINPTYLLTFNHDLINDEILLDGSWKVKLENSRYILWTRND